MEVATIDKIVKDFQYAYLSKIVETKHSATGNLGLNQKYFLDFDGRYFTISLELEEYWKYLENGTKPHWPPVNKILEWIKVKPVLPRADKNGKIPTENQLAFLISRKISKVGTPATHLLRDTLSEFNLVGKVYKAFIEVWKDEEIRKIIEETK